MQAQYPNLHPRRQAATSKLCPPMHNFTHVASISSQWPAEAKDKLERALKATAVMASPEAFLNICLGDAIVGRHEVICWKA